MFNFTSFNYYLLLLLLELPIFYLLSFKLFRKDLSGNYKIRSINIMLYNSVRNLKCFSNKVDNFLKTVFTL